MYAFLLYVDNVLDFPILFPPNEVTICSLILPFFDSYSTFVDNFKELIF